MALFIPSIFFPIWGLKRKKRPFQRALKPLPKSIFWIFFFLVYLSVYWFQKTKNIAVRTFVPQIFYYDQTSANLASSSEISVLYDQNCEVISPMQIRQNQSTWQSQHMYLSCQNIEMSEEKHKGRAGLSWFLCWPGRRSQ